MTVWLRSSLGLVVVVLALLASVASILPEPPPPPPPEWVYESAVPLSLGHFYGPHGTYEEGEPVPVERGFQGGQHVNVNLASAELADGDEGDIVAWVIDAEDESVIAGPERGPIAFYASYGDLPDDKVYSFGTVVVQRPDDVMGREAEIRVQLTLSDGRVARVWHKGTLEWLPDDWQNNLPDAGPPVDDAGEP